MRTLRALMLATLVVGLLAGPGSAQEKKAAAEPKAATKGAPQDAAAARASCEAQCRQDHQGDTAATQACVRGCGAVGPARGANLNSSKSN